VQLGSILQTLFFLPRHDPKGEFLTNLDFLDLFFEFFFKFFFDFLDLFFEFFFDFLPFKHLPVVLLLRCPIAQDFLHLLVDLFLTYPILQEFLVLNIGFVEKNDVLRGVGLGGVYLGGGVGLGGVYLGGGVGLGDVGLGGGVGLGDVGLGGGVGLGDVGLGGGVGLGDVDLGGGVGLGGVGLGGILSLSRTQGGLVSPVFSVSSTYHLGKQLVTFLLSAVALIYLGSVSPNFLNLSG